MLTPVRRTRINLPLNDASCSVNFIRLTYNKNGVTRKNRKNCGREVQMAENDQAAVINGFDQWIMDEWDTDDEEVEAQWAEEREDFSSPIFAAVVAGDLITTRILLEQGVDKNETTNWGRTILYHAASNGYVDIVQLLLEQGVDINLFSGDRRLNIAGTALCVAAYNDHLDVVRFLVEQGADMEKPDSNLWTPLSYASCYGHLEVARYLLEQGANRDKSDLNGFTPLHFAISNEYSEGCLDVVKLLMVYGADLNARDNSGRTPIDLADVQCVEGYLNSEEIRQAIRDEPRRRMDEAPGKRCTEEDRHTNAATSAFADLEHGDEEEEDEIEVEAVSEEGVVADEDQDSEPSSDEDNNGKL